MSMTGILEPPAWHAVGTGIRRRRRATAIASPASRPTRPVPRARWASRGAARTRSPRLACGPPIERTPSRRRQECRTTRGSATGGFARSVRTRPSLASRGRRPSHPAARGRCVRARSGPTPMAVTTAPADSSTSCTSARASASSSTARTRTPCRLATRVRAAIRPGRESPGSGRSAATAAAGSRTRNVVPRPSPSLDTSTDPPCISTMCRTIDRPIPRPPVFLVVPASACRNRSNTCGRNSGLMPTPESLTSRQTNAPRRATWTCTVPSRGVNFTALASRFHTTCCRRLGSPGTVPAPASTPAWTCTPLASEAGSTVAMALWTTNSNSTGCTSRRSFPARMRDTSRTSSTIWASAFAFRSIVSIARSAFWPSSIPPRRSPV